MTQDNPF